MPREDIVVPSRELSYEGYFSVKDVLEIIKRYLEERDYTRIERVHEHQQHADGTVIEIRGFHERMITDHDKFEFDAFLTFSKIKDVEMTVNHTKQKLNSGRMSLTFKGILFADWDDVWASKDPNNKKSINKANFGFGALIRWVADSMVFSEQTKALRRACKKDVDDLYDTLVEYFNAQAYRKQ